MLWYNLALFLAALAGFLYGAMHFFKGKKALYLQMIVCGLGCMMLGRLFQVVMVLHYGYMPQGFHVGYLGHIGMFLFFFSANFGQMDSLVDDGSGEFRRYRLLAVAAPLAAVLGYLPIALGSGSLSTKLSCAVVMLVIALAAYFHLKHLLIPDVEFGIIRSIRGYNLIALVLSVLSVAELTLLSFGHKWDLIPVGIGMCACYLALLPVLSRGVKRWTM